MSTSVPEQPTGQQPTGAAQKPKVRPKTRTIRSAKKATPTNPGAKAGKRARTHTRPGSKTAKILHLLKRSGGATLKDLMKATDWQAHSVRGFLSGALRKRMGVTITSSKSESGERRYTVKV